MPSTSGKKARVQLLRSIPPPPPSARFEAALEEEEEEEKEVKWARRTWGLLAPVMWFLLPLPRTTWSIDDSPP